MSGAGLETGPASAAEVEASRRLADALDGGDTAGVDSGALAAVRLLASLRERSGDEVATRRGEIALENALRAVARRRRAVRLLAPLAAALVLAAGLAGGRRAVSTRIPEAVLAARQAEARAALEGLTTDPSGFRTARAEALLAGLSASRFESYRRELAAGAAVSAGAQPSPTGTPSGGRS